MMQKFLRGQTDYVRDAFVMLLSDFLFGFSRQLDITLVHFFVLKKPMGAVRFELTTARLSVECMLPYGSNQAELRALDFIS